MIIDSFRKLATRSARPNSKLSLHWGSHHTLPTISQNLIEITVDESTGQGYQCSDPIINSFVYRHSFTDRIIARISNARIDVLSGGIYIGNTLILESLNRDRKVANASFFKCDFKPDSVIVVPKDTHYHWLIEILPRILRAVEYSPSSVLMASTNLTSVQKESLEIFGVEVHYCDKRHQPFEVVLAAFGLDSGWPHPNDVMAVRKKLLIPELPGTLPVFISRSGNRRSDTSTMKLDSWATSKGLEVVRCESLSWKDQLALFREASSIIGEHGAGLSNLILAPKGTLLSEVYRGDYANPCFQNLSNVINEKNQSFYNSYDYKEFLKDNNIIDLK